MISVIVCTYNRDKYIVKCLESIANQSADKSRFELIIINNKSTDNSHNLINHFITEYANKCNCSYFKEENQGLSFARNRGIKESKGDFLVFVDDDAFLETTYIENLENNLKQYGTEVFGYGGKILPFLESPLPKWMSPYLMPLMSVIDKGNEIVEFPSKHYPIGANMGMSKKAIEQVGNFNVNLGRVGKNLMGGEEKDLFVRMKSAGFKIYYFPHITVNHVVPDSRLTLDFIKKQGLGIGMSERIRVENEGKFSTFKRWILELYKWFGSLVLFFIYLLKGQVSKGIMIVKFRWWVTLGLGKKQYV